MKKAMLSQIMDKSLKTPNEKTIKAIKDIREGKNFELKQILNNMNMVASLAGLSLKEYLLKIQKDSNILHNYILEKAIRDLQVNFKDAEVEFDMENYVVTKTIDNNLAQTCFERAFNYYCSEIGLDEPYIID